MKEGFDIEKELDKPDTPERGSSIPDTTAHIAKVAAYCDIFARVCDASQYLSIYNFGCDLRARGKAHDASKLVLPELSYFDYCTPMLASMTYGSPEYTASLELMNVGIQHHYKHNRHHPEFHTDGIDGMTLIDLLELTADWKAAGERHKGGNIEHSVAINRKRFNMNSQLCALISNTVNKVICGDMKIEYLSTDVLSMTLFDLGEILTMEVFRGKTVQYICDTYNFDGQISRILTNTALSFFN